MYAAPQHDVQCDGCQQRPLRGVRFACAECPYNLCAICFPYDACRAPHSEAHRFEAIRRPRVSIQHFPQAPQAPQAPTTEACSTADNGLMSVEEGAWAGYTFK